jgi:hypothetical protein
MVPLYVGSTASYSGKSLVTMGIGARLKRDGYKVGYFKPLGTHPRREGGVVTDDGTWLIYNVLGLQDPLELVCPVILTHDLQIKAYGEDVPGLEDRIVRAYKEVSKDKDVMLVGGAVNLYFGAFLGIAQHQLVKKLGLKVLLVDRYDGEFCVDCILAGKELLGNRLVGVVLNAVSLDYRRDVEELVAAFLGRKGIQLLGALPHDEILGSIKVRDLVENLSAKLLCCHDKLDGLVKRFLIGGMQVDKFLEYYRKAPHNAVIVGGDRSDVQMVAVEGHTECLILTGDLYPSEFILARAEQRGVPIMLVRDDTYTVAQKIQRLSTRLRLRETEKVKRALRIVDKHLDFARLYSLLGLPRPQA